jgi:hypothetical protein
VEGGGGVADKLIELAQDLGDSAEPLPALVRESMESSYA